MEQTKAQLQQAYDETYADLDDVNYVLRNLDMQPAQNTVRLNVRESNYLGRLRAGVLRQSLEAIRLELEEQCSVLKAKINKFN